MTGPLAWALGHRVSVVGTTGSGKTSTASLLARRLGVRHIELDSLHWGPDWTPVPRCQFRERVADAVGCPAWVCDGNYRSVRDIVWANAQAVVWLDYPLSVIMCQLLWRTIRRALRREELWEGNHESLQRSFFSRDSVLLWALRSHGRRRREYEALLAEPEWAHLVAVRLRSPSATRAWLQQPTLTGVGD